MASTGELQKKLKELSDMESKLWDAFKRAEKQFAPPVINIYKAQKDTTLLVKKGLLNKFYNYPLAMIFMVSTIAASLYSAWALVAYLAALFYGKKSRESYVHAFAVDKLGSSNYVKHGFGLPHLSLIVLGTTDIFKSEVGKIKRDELASILKIAKASQEYGDVNFGLLERIKTYLFAGFVALCSFLINQKASIESELVAAWNDITTNPFVGVFLLYLLVMGSLVIYNTWIAEVRAKIKKKKYLLLLNIIYEGWV